MDFLELWEQMGTAVKSLMLLLGLMSMWSVGVFIERVFTFQQATKQSKLFAPQVAKHLKDGKLKDAIAVSQSKNYKYSHLGKVVLAGLQEYQFQQDSGMQLEKEDVVDSVRRAIQRAGALTAADLKKGMGGLATIGSTAVFIGLGEATRRSSSSDDQEVFGCLKRRVLALGPVLDDRTLADGGPSPPRRTRARSYTQRAMSSFDQPAASKCSRSCGGSTTA